MNLICHRAFGLSGARRWKQNGNSTAPLTLEHFGKGVRATTAEEILSHKRATKAAQMRRYRARQKKDKGK